MSATAPTEHKSTAPASVRCYIITVSDTRTEATDASGRAIAGFLTQAGHHVAGRTIVKDEPALVRDAITRQIATRGIDAVGSSRVDLQACKLEYSIVSPK